MPDGPELVAPFVLEYSYKRSTGPVIGAYLTGLRDGCLLGSQTADGRVLMPPCEYDPLTGQATTGLTEVATTGELLSWTWIASPGPGNRIAVPHGWGLIQIDDTEGALLHIVRTDDPARLRAHARVQAVWRTERTGSLTDIEYFELVP